jgi:hypothetical protein
VTADSQTTPHTVTRLAVPLGRPYDEVIDQFEKLIPVVAAERFRQLDTWDAVVDLAAKEAPLGFMRYGKVDVLDFLAASAPKWACVEYLMGNHVIAERMYRHDPAAMLHAPLRVVIHADDAGDAVFVIDQPSTLFAGFARADIASVGRELDEKVAGVLAALGAVPPRELTRHSQAVEEGETA